MFGLGPATKIYISLDAVDNESIQRDREQALGNFQAAIDQSSKRAARVMRPGNQKQREWKRRRRCELWPTSHWRVAARTKVWLRSCRS